jgi:hypothetical protein
MITPLDEVNRVFPDTMNEPVFLVSISAHDLFSRVQ